MPHPLLVIGFIGAKIGAMAIYRQVTREQKPGADAPVQADTRGVLLRGADDAIDATADVARIAVRKVASAFGHSAPPVRAKD